MSPAKLRHHEFGWIEFTALMPMIVWTTPKICVMGICAIGNYVRQGMNVTDAAVLNRGAVPDSENLFSSFNG